MKFCEKCENLLIVRKEKDQNFFYCKNCKVKTPTDQKVVITINNSYDQKKDIIVLNEESSFPKTKILCPRCQTLEEAEWTLIQTRSADEPPTRFYRCIKCRHVWREYA